ncbi:MAG: SDR family NAD(P)-dependent oxidoreductase [Cytophagales bacterium]|nr:MAG: SDR family NAD(P)-dependent oxidoreductase [Cytophagales bacterium]
MILITGITGLVGSAVAKQLIDEGYKVRGLVRNPKNTQLISEKYSNQIDWIEGDVLDISSIQNSLKDISCIIHCAAIISFHSAQKEKMYKTNVEGTANMVNAALINNIYKFIHVSSVAALGRVEKRITVDENVHWEDSELNSNYAKSKYWAELEVWRAAEEGLNISIVNPSIVLGAGELSKSSTKLFDYIIKGNRFYAEGNMNYVDVKNVVQGISKLVKEDFFNERFILNGGTCSYKLFFDSIAKQLGKKEPSIKVPPLLLAIGWRLATFISFFTKKEPFLTRETAEIAKSNFYYQNDKSIRILGLNYNSLDQTIKEVCDILMKPN